jgi:integrase
VRWQAQKVAVVAFAWAKNQGLLDTNPLSDYRKNARCGKRQTFITLDQYKTLKAACSDPAFKDLLEVLWETGARPFEVFQATARHFDPTAGHLRYIRANGDKVKSHATRTIWLSQRALEIVAERVQRYPEGVLFRNGYNQKWTVTACSRRLAALRRATGLTVTLYDLRHGFAHHHATKGTNIVTLAALMGHSSIKTLAEVYAHVGDNAECMRAAVRA